MMGAYLLKVWVLPYTEPGRAVICAVYVPAFLIFQYSV
jgi:hypothetical protein